MLVLQANLVRYVKCEPNLKPLKKSNEARSVNLRGNFSKE